MQPILKTLAAYDRYGITHGYSLQYECQFLLEVNSMQSDAIERKLTDENKRFLLSQAREALNAAVRQETLPDVELDNLPEVLQTPLATFVTLTIGGALRGCIGGLEAQQPLVLDVREHAAAAGLNDYRFPPVTPAEIPAIHIEISILTPPQAVYYDEPKELARKIRPGIDGVVLVQGLRRATFLPQVWEKLPAVEDFLGHLCQKMGAARNYWLYEKLDAYTYQVISFEEDE